MQVENEQSIRGCAWSHFALHAGQRWDALKCFIAVAGLLAAGIVALFREGASAWLAVPAGGLLTALAILFWLFDRRKHSLLQAIVAALKEMDAQNTPASASGAPNPGRLFEADEFRSRGGILATGLGHGGFSGSVYGLAVLLGLYLSALPLIVKTPLFAEPEAGARANPLSGNLAQHPRPGPTYPMPAAMTPPHRPNIAPVTSFPRPPVILSRPQIARPGAATPLPAPNPAAQP